MTEQPQPFDPGAYTVAEVQDYVTANPDQAGAVREAEAAGKARTTLLAWLDEQAPGAPQEQLTQGWVEGGTQTDAGGRPVTDSGGRIKNKDDTPDVP